ncbi:MAG TPA: glycosyltransferase family 4 protein [Actinomycetes bacterium]|nr:glycosyltransferase family 4 protein [Actinomycetes bacterium]
MRILLLAQFYPPKIGGEERHVRNLALALTERGHDVAVVTYGDQSTRTPGLRDGVRVYTVRPTTARLPFLYSDSGHLSAPPMPDPEVVLALRSILGAERPQVVHAHNWIVNSLVPLRGRLTAKVLLTLHDFSHVCATKRFMERDQALCSGPRAAKCLRCVATHYRPVTGISTYLANTGMRPLRRALLDRVLAVSRAVAEGNGLPAWGVPYDVVPNFIPDELLTVRPAGRPDGAPDGDYLLFVGDLSRDKGIPVLLEAYGALGRGRPPLLLVGKRTASTPERIPPGATYGFSWDHTAVLSAYQHALAVVAPSILPDACPTVVLEAMAAGRPVLGSRIGGMTDIISPGVDGLLVEPGQVEELTGALAALSGDAALRERLAAGAAATVKRYTASTVVSRVESVYEDLLDD